MSTTCSSSSCRPIISTRSIHNIFIPSTGPSVSVRQSIRCRFIAVPRKSRVCILRASMVDSHESSSNFMKRVERAWLISQQPKPIACSSCESNGHVECQWCGGTGFFIIGDNMLCQVPSRNTTCVICAGKGSRCCSDCKGTGFRAKWLEDLPTSKP